MRVAIVDDDLWVRRGRASALGELPGFDVIDFTPQGAVAFGARWAEIDVAVVDAFDDSEPFDRFPGVGVVETIRANGSAEGTVVLVVSGHIDNVFLRLRMAEAGADYFYRHEDVRDLLALRTAVCNPDPARAVRVPDPAELAAVGLGPGSRPNAALHFLEDEGLVDAFEARRSQKSLDLSRRAIIRIRRQMGRLAELSPAAPDGPTRHLDAPEWRAVVDFVNRARGVERRGGATHVGRGRRRR